MRLKHPFAAKSTWRNSASEKTSNAITGNHKGRVLLSHWANRRNTVIISTHTDLRERVYEMSLHCPAFWYLSAAWGGVRDFCKSFILWVEMFLVVTPKGSSLKRNHDSRCGDLEYTTPIRKGTNMSSIQLMPSPGWWFGGEHLELLTMKQTNTYSYICMDQIYL